MNILKHHRGLATRYDKLAVRYAATVRIVVIARGFACPAPRESADLGRGRRETPECRGSPAMTEQSGGGRTDDERTSRRAHSGPTGQIPAPAVAQELADSADPTVLASVIALSMLTVDGRNLDRLLRRVAQFAVDAIAGADGASVTVIADDRHKTVGPSAEFVRQLDAAQEKFHQGPSIAAHEGQSAVRSGALAREASWPRFGTRAAQLGVHSVLSVPLPLPDRSIGALTLYSRQHNAFGDAEQRLAQLFAAPATAVVHSASLLARAREQVAQLQQALESRATIDQAIGILISRSGDTAEQAFTTLRTISQREHVRLAVVAARLVERAARRARARHHRS